MTESGSTPEKGQVIMTSSDQRAKARFARFVHSNRSLSAGKEKATMKKIFNQAALVVAIICMLMPNLAFAQAAAAQQQTASADSPLYPVQTWEDTAKLYQYVLRIYYVRMQETYVAEQAKPSVRQIVDDGYSQPPKDKKAAQAQQEAKDKQFERFTNLFVALGFILSAPGENVPSELDQAFKAYLSSHGCNQGADGKWTGCMPLYDEVKAKADEAIAAAPAGDFKENAKKLLDTAHQYAYVGPNKPSPDTAGDAIILAHGVLAGITPVLEDDDRPWPGLSSAELVDRMKGKPVTIIEGDKSTPDRVAEVTDDGIVMESGTTVGWDDPNKAVVIGDGLPADFLRSGGSDRPEYVWVVYGRGFTRIMVGPTPGYDGLVGNHGGMVVGRGALSPYVGVQVGFGACGTTGNPTVGVDKADSRAGFCGMAGIDVLPLGDKPVGPVLEANALMAGKGGGAEVGAGLNVNAGHFFGRVLMTGGYVDTRQVPYTHPDTKVQSVKGMFLGAVLGAGVRF